MSHKSQRKQFFLFIGLCLVFNFNVSCKKNNEIPISKDSITILYIGDERIFHQDYWGMGATYWIFLPLVTMDIETGEMQPVLAENWTHSYDYREWKVNLRKDIYWHDGVQMTAHDIKFTIDLRKKVLGINLTECEIIDDFTFKLKTNKPMSSLPTWRVYYPKHLLEKLDPDDFYNWDFWTHPIGNGPYKFVRNVPKTMVEVEVNPNYFRNKPKIKKAILKFTTNISLNELLGGNVDAITFAPRDFLFKIDNDQRYKSYYWWHNHVETIFWNHNNTMFSQAKVRKALTMAIDRVELASVLNYPNNVPISDVLYSERQKITNDFPAPLSYNPNKAIELLKECGWIDTNGDGVLDKNGIDFKFTLTIPIGTIDTHKLMPIYIQDKLRKIGVIMDIETVEFNSVKQLFEKRDFDAILSILYNEENELHNITDYLGASSYLGYSNPVLNNLFEQMDATGDKNKIDSLYKETFSILENDMPVTFLVPQVRTHIVKSNIKGLSNLFKADPVWFLEYLWIE